MERSGARLSNCRRQSRHSAVNNQQVPALKTCSSPSAAAAAVTAQQRLCLSCVNSVQVFLTLRIEAYMAGRAQHMTVCLCHFLTTAHSKGTSESNGPVPPAACQDVSPPSAVRLFCLLTFYGKPSATLPGSKHARKFNMVGLFIFFFTKHTEQRQEALTKGI